MENRTNTEDQAVLSLVKVKRSKHGKQLYLKILLQHWKLNWKKICTPIFLKVLAIHCLVCWAVAGAMPLRIVTALRLTVFFPWWNPFVDDHVVEHEAGLNNPVAFLRREFMKVPCLKRKKQWWVLNWSTAFYTLKNITMKVNNSAINLLVFEKIKFRLFEQQSKSMVLFFFKNWIFPSNVLLVS